MSAVLVPVPSSMAPRDVVRPVVTMAKTYAPMAVLGIALYVAMRHLR